GERAARLDAAHAAVRLPAGEAAATARDRPQAVPGQGNALLVPEGDARPPEGAARSRAEDRRPESRAGEGAARAVPPEVEGGREPVGLRAGDLAEPARADRRDARDGRQARGAKAPGRLTKREPASA